MMFTDTFIEVLRHEGVVSIVSWGKDEPHVTCTWNSYLVLDGGQILIPAAGMKSTEADAAVQPKVKLSLGAREVMGRNNYLGTGFEVLGTAAFLTEGAQYDQMKEKFPFLSRVLCVTVTSLRQLL